MQKYATNFTGNVIFLRYKAVVNGASLLKYENLFFMLFLGIFYLEYFYSTKCVEHSTKYVEAFFRPGSSWHNMKGLIFFVYLYGSLVFGK